MSIAYCETCDRRIDFDFVDCCPVGNDGVDRCLFVGASESSDEADKRITLGSELGKSDAQR